MNNVDVNSLLVKWQAKIVRIELEKPPYSEAKSALNDIINKVIEHKEQIVSGELGVLTNILFFSNLAFYGKKYGADVEKLAFLGLGE